MRILPTTSSALRVSKSLTTTSTSTSRPVTSQSVRPFSTTNARKADNAHEDHFDPPSGWLFGVKPGEKPPQEGWENIWVYGFFGSLVLGAVGYAFKPDTSIQTWALEEARRRLEVEGILAEPKDKS